MSRFGTMAGLLDNPARSKTAMEEKGGGRGWVCLVDGLLRLCRRTSRCSWMAVES